MLISRLAEEEKHIFEARIVRPGLDEIYAAYLAGGIHRAGEEVEQDDENENGADTADGETAGGEEPRPTHSHTTQTRPIQKSKKREKFSLKKLFPLRSWYSSKRT